MFCVLFIIKFVANFLINIPIITGKVTTKNIFKDIPNIEILFAIYETFNNSADLKTIKGTVNILIKLIIAVSETDKATSPFANFVRTLDVTPPGAAAIIITPKANSKGVFKIFINKNAIIGRSISWQKKPIKKSLGCFKTLKKSCVDRPRPSPSIIKAKAIGAIFVTISILWYINLYIHFQNYI